MTAYEGFGGLRPRRDLARLWWGIGGLVIGVAIGLAAPRIGQRLKGAPQKTDAVAAAATPRPRLVEVLRISAQPAQRGLVISSPLPVQLLKPSETKGTKQQGQAVFTGFRNWRGTTNYLASGEGILMIKAGNGAVTKWTAAECRGLVQNKPLNAKVATGHPYTLFFQREGRRAVDLGTFKVNPSPPAATGTPQATSEEPLN